MESYLFFIIFLIALTLWIKSLWLLHDKKVFWKHLFTHMIIISTYTYFWYQYSELIVGHDEYGLGKLFGYLLLLIVHSIIGYVILKANMRKHKI